MGGFKYFREIKRLAYTQAGDCSGALFWHRFFSSFVFFSIFDQILINDIETTSGKLKNFHLF